MPNRNRHHSAKSNIYYSPPIAASDFTDLPTPVVSPPPPLPLPELPALVEFSPDPDPGATQLDPTPPPPPIVTTADRYDDDPFTTSPPVVLVDTATDPPLSPLLLKESEPPGNDDVLNFEPVEESHRQQQHVLPAGDTTMIWGHTRSPVLAREPTMLENFSRAVRNYVPTSIPIPTAAPSPPRVSRPVSFGSFMTSTTTPGPTATRMPAGSGGGGGSAEVHEYGYGFRGNTSTGTSRQPQGDYYDYPVSHRKNLSGADREHDYGRAPWARDHYHRGMEDEDEGWRSGRGGGARDESQVPFASRAYSPQYDVEDDVFWAHWDVLGHGANFAQQRRLLFLGYAFGMQIWDCTDLAVVSEVLNLSGSDWGYISSASVIPRPRLAEGVVDPLSADRPVIGTIATVRDESTFIVYSLHRHRVVKRIPLVGLAVFTSNQHFTVISTINPPSLHILSSATFAALYTISSTSLFSNPATIRTSNVILSPSEIETEKTHHGPWKTSFGEHIYALSGRLLAFASSPPHTSSAAPASSRQPQTQTQLGNQSPSSRFGMNITQADISNVAIKVGGTVLSGMKSLGEKAYSAALLRAGLAMESMSGVSAKGIPGPRGDDTGIARFAGVGRFFSRSAPAAANDHHERRFSTSPHSNPDLEHEHEHERHHHQDEDGNEFGNLVLQGGQPSTSSSSPPAPPPTTVPSVTSTASHGGHYVTVLDLEPLLSGTGAVKATPRKVAEFMTSKSRPIGQIVFSGDGNSIMVLPKDGQVSKVFQLRPRPNIFKSAVREREGRTGVESDSSLRRDAPWHLYDLRRGRTNAVIEGVAWAEDGRWIAIGTRKRTIHVFAVNPYGGKPDQQSHMEGKVRNYTQLQPLSTEGQPIVRLRYPNASAQQKPRSPLVFTFIKSTESLPDTLLPPATLNVSDALGPSSLPKSDAGSSEPTSPRRPTNFQDILVFDPTDGVMSLGRIFVDLRPRDQRISVPASVPVLGATSVSLPGSGGVGRLGTSPPTMNTKAVGSNFSGYAQSGDANMDLVGKESVVATWSLRRSKDWKEIKRDLQEPLGGTPAGLSNNDVLAHAELSTSSTSPRVLPRSIYLSHQFSFHTLGEDYHALIRRYQFDIGGSEIEVRKKVQVSAYGAGVGESFLGGFSTPRDIHRAESAFDEPLASALSAELDHQPPTSAAVLPMLPNGGIRGSKPISFKNSIPIRRMAAELSDGMTDGIGRIRREIHKARSPPRSSSAASGGGRSAVPLEFDDDEDDDDFMGYDVGTLRDDGVGGGSGGTASTKTKLMSLDADYEADDLWKGWEPEDRQAIEDAERFDHISVVGFLDEEHASMVEAEKNRRRR